MGFYRKCCGAGALSSMLGLLPLPIRKGVFERSVVDKIAELAQHISQSGNTDLSEDDMTAMYAEL